MEIKPNYEPLFKYEKLEKISNIVLGSIGIAFFGVAPWKKDSKAEKDRAKIYTINKYDSDSWKNFSQVIRAFVSLAVIRILYLSPVIYKNIQTMSKDVNRDVQYIIDNDEKHSETDK